MAVLAVCDRSCQPHHYAQVQWFSFEWFKHEALADFDFVWRMDVDLWLKFPVGVLK